MRGRAIRDTHFVRKTVWNTYKIGGKSLQQAFFKFVTLNRCSWEIPSKILTQCIFILVQFLCSKPVFLGNPQQDPYTMHFSSLFKFVTLNRCSWEIPSKILTQCIFILVQFLCSKPVFLGNPQQDPYTMHFSSLFKFVTLNRCSWEIPSKILTQCIFILVQFLCSKPVFLGNPQQDPYTMHFSSLFNFFALNRCSWEIPSKILTQCIFHPCSISLL